MTLRNNGLIKTFVAATAIDHCRFVKFDTTDKTIALATAAADLVLGVSDFNPAGTQAAIGERVDVGLTWIATVLYGGTVTRGQLIMTDSTGRAITAAAAAGVNVRTCGIAMVSGVVGDLGAVLLMPGSFQG